MSTDINLSRNGGLTTLDIARTLESDPAAAAQLGTYFRAQDSVRVQHRNLGTFDVQGDTESVNYGRTSSSDVAANMQGGPVMLANAEYAISASGTIDKNGGWWGGDVSPTDTASDGRTRLQVAVVKDGQVLRTENFRPDADGQMRITPRRGEEGATLGFFMLDGTDASERADNSGTFKVSVDETTETRTASAIAVRAQDAEGIRVAGQQIAQAFETAPEAAYLPEPDRSLADCPAGRGIVRDADNNSAVTTDGYVFRFQENKVSIYAPDRDEPISTFDGRNVTEADGTTWKAESGNYIAPNGALLRLEYDGNNLRAAELIHGDSRLKVDGAGPADGAVSLGQVEGGGYDRRRDLVEGDALGNTYRLGGDNLRLDDLDVTWSVERRGADLGVVASGHDGQRGREVLERIPYYVAPELKPAFGTQDHERMLRSEIEDQRSTLSGLGQAEGATPDEARLVADYLLGPVSGQYQEYADRMSASRDAREIRNWLPGNESPEASREMIQQYQQQLMMQQLMGGLPAYFKDFPEAMAAIQQLVAVLASQASMQSDFQAGASNLRSYIPSVAAAQANQTAMAPEMVVDQALRGLNNRNGRNPLERFDLNSGAQYAARRAGRDPGAALLARRMAEATPTDRTDRSDRTQPMSKEVEAKATDLAMQIHDAVDGLGGTDVAKLTDLLSKASPQEKAALKIVYQQLYGESVEDAIAGDTSFNTESSLLSMLNSTASTTNVVVDDAKATQDAATLNEAMRSDWWNPGTWGTSDDKLQEVMNNRSPAELKRISEIYEASYGESLRDAITDDTSGDYQATLLAQLDRAEGAKPLIVSSNPAEVEANQAALAINNAVRGAGTDNQKLVDVLSALSNEGKAKLQEVYPKLYGESLEDAIKGDTNDHWDLDFQNTLLALAQNPRSTATTADELKATQDAARFRAAITTWDGTDEAVLDELLTTRSPAEIKRMGEIYQSRFGESLAEAIEGDTSGWSKTALLHQLSLQ
ncbi:MAG: hypothetical protein IPG45_18880 [Deltaproteobacteria bacterium]|nr:hypothetical protein [Deltaproteobacteria bacterium]